MERLVPTSDFWKGKKVFITGHTGFKGSWLCLLLNHLGANIYGYALEPNTDPNLYTQANIDEFVTSTIEDIRNESDLHNALAQSNAEIVFHMAAQPLVRESYNDPKYTYETNAIGTVNLFESVRKLKSVKAVVNITTDKCYDNNETLQSYIETDALGGYDPYSASKACSEIITSSYRDSYFNPVDYQKHKTLIASARAGNVIGGGDWAADRLIPDFLRSIIGNEIIEIRYPDAIRPWQHVLEPLTGYLLLAEKLYNGKAEFASAWNFGPLNEEGVKVKEIIELIFKGLAKKPNYNIDQGQNPHEAHYLKLNSKKANNLLNWYPKYNAEQAINLIVKYINSYLADESIKELCLSQIKDYLKE